MKLSKDELAEAIDNRKKIYWINNKYGDMGHLGGYPWKPKEALWLLNLRQWDFYLNYWEAYAQSIMVKANYEPSGEVSSYHPR